MTFLFSEEAERMWHRRQAEWEKEQKARDKLMTEVLQGLQKQVSLLAFLSIMKK